MATSKKTIKVRDLKPSKDAKGGGGHAVNSMHAASSISNSAAASSTKVSSHGHPHAN